MVNVIPRDAIPKTIGTRVTENRTYGPGYDLLFQ